MEKPAVKRRHWNPAEDNSLREIISRGALRWTTVSQILHSEFGVKDRSGKQCRERWCNHLNPCINRAPWTHADNARLLTLHNEYGNSWVKLSCLLNRRTENSVKNQYYILLRKQYKKFFGTEPSRNEIKFNEKFLKSSFSMCIPY